jgi:hypothetical protein
VDQILLYCYHYDPKVGRYGAVVMNMVRLGGVAAVLVLSTFLAVMWRRDFRRDRGAHHPAPPSPHPAPLPRGEGVLEASRSDATSVFGPPGEGKESA